MEVARTPTVDALERGAAVLRRRAADGAQPRLGGRARAWRRCWPHGPAGGARGGRGDPARGRGGQRRARPPRRRRARDGAAAGARDGDDALQLRRARRLRPRNRPRRDRRAARTAAPVHVLACEARPLLQGARLTVWELRRLGIEHALLVDAAAAGLLRTRRGARRRHRLRPRRGQRGRRQQGRHLRRSRSPPAPPACRSWPPGRRPRSTCGCRAATGIEIEERDADEVRAAGGALLTIAGTPCRNPAFDVTPAELVWALVTEHGAARPVTADTVARVA